MMRDLVDRGRVMNNLFDAHPIGFNSDDIADAFKNAPCVDAVEVVRCKDCKHRGIVSECPMCYTEDSYDEDYGYDYWDVDKTVDDGFCHCGEKWDAEVEE